MPLPAPIPQTEQSLIQAFQTNKKAAFTTLYTAYAPTLRGVLVRLVVDQARADDLLQDTFIRIWTNLHGYDAQQGRLFTWLLTITKNVALDELNRRKRHQKASEYLYHQVSYQMDGLAPEAIVQQPLFDRVAPKYRQILEFTYQGYTQDEIARQLNLPLGTVKTRYRTGLQTLKLLFKQDIQYYTKCHQL